MQHQSSSVERLCCCRRNVQRWTEPAAEREPALGLVLERIPLDIQSYKMEPKRVEAWEQVQPAEAADLVLGFPVLPVDVL